MLILFVFVNSASANYYLLNYSLKIKVKLISKCYLDFVSWLQCKGQKKYLLAWLKCILVRHVKKEIVDLCKNIIWKVSKLFGWSVEKPDIVDLEELTLTSTDKRKVKHLFHRIIYKAKSRLMSQWAVSRRIYSCFFPSIFLKPSSPSPKLL